MRYKFLNSKLMSSGIYQWMLAARSAVTLKRELNKYLKWKQITELWRKNIAAQCEL